MPSYKYECEKCGEVAEVVCSMDDREKSIPKHCKKKMARIFNAPSVYFFGNGFTGARNGK
jgi:putative FmdB family regulatory protein